MFRTGSQCKSRVVQRENSFSLARIAREAWPRNRRRRQSIGIASCMRLARIWTRRVYLGQRDMLGKENCILAHNSTTQANDKQTTVWSKQASRAHFGRQRWSQEEMQHDVTMFEELWGAPRRKGRHSTDLYVLLEFGFRQFRRSAK